jgi:hypothetical protein
MSKQIVQKGDTHQYEPWAQESPKSELQLRSYEGLS